MKHHDVNIIGKERRRKKIGIEEAQFEMTFFYEFQNLYPTFHFN